MLVTIIIAIASTIMSHNPPSKPTIDLWIRAYCSWHLFGGVRPNPDDDLRSISERRADLGKSFRNLAKFCIPLVQERIDICKKHIKDNENSEVPEIQASVKHSRQHLADSEKDLKWYRQFLEVSNEGPIHFPER